MQQAAFFDLDNDGLCITPEEVVENDDCNDGNAEINPGAQEVCNGLDDNCDGIADDADASVTGTTTWYMDGDSDGYGDESLSLDACEQPSGYVASGDDCDDASGTISPAAVETCNSVDDDCDGVTGTADSNYDYGSGSTCSIE